MVDKLIVNGELNQSELQVDPGPLSYRDSLKFFGENNSPEPNKARGEAWNLEARGTFNNTRIQARYGYLSPDYFSMGAPLLITDRTRYNFRLDHAFFKQQLRVGGFLRKDAEQLLAYKIVRSTVTSGGISLDARFAGMPWLRLDIAPYFQQSSNQDSLLQQRQVGVITANTGYNYGIGDLQANTVLVYSRQVGNSSDSLGDFRADSWSLQQQVSWKEYSLMLTAGYFHQNFSFDLGQTLTLEASLSARVFERLTLTGGLSWLNEKDGLCQLRYFSQAFYPINKTFNVQAIGQYARYSGPPEEVLFPNEQILQVVLGVNW